MKTIIKIVSIITLCLASSGAWAQTNTKVTGKLKGLEAGTVVYLASASSRFENQESVVVGKGKFEFNLALEEVDYYQLTIGKDRSVPGTTIRFYLQPGVVNIKGEESLLLNAELSGSKFAVEQNDLKNYIDSAEDQKSTNRIMQPISRHGITKTRRGWAN